MWLLLLLKCRMLQDERMVHEVASGQGLQEEPTGHKDRVRCQNKVRKSQISIYSDKKR